MENVASTQTLDSPEVIKLRDGCEKAFSLLYNRYAKKIYNISRKMGLDHEDTEGVVQEVFIIVWRTRSSLDSTLSFNAYLISIVRSVISKYFKKKVRFATYQKYAITTSLTQTNNTEDLVIFSNLDELSTKMIEKLPDGQRQVFMMKNIENLSTEEIAEKLNISRRTVENQAYRASKWLREKLAL